MYFFQKFLGDRMISSTSTSADIISYASSFTSGEVGVTLINRSVDSKTVEIVIKNFRKGNNFYWYTLTGSNDNGEFSRKVLVNGNGPASVAGGPVNYKTISAYAAATAGGIRITVPGRSAIYSVIDKQ